MKVDLRTDILGSNNQIAVRNRERFDQSRLFVLNLMSSPGAGKTSLLERMVRDLQGRLNVAVIEGDVQTEQDAQRVRAAGAQAVQIETRGACHLDARMIERVLDRFALDDLDILVIENVGNLVCPASFELGEHAKVVMLSVPEGDDKPSKYPAIFRKAQALLVNKVDLLPHVDFDLDRVLRDATKLQPDVAVFPLSCKTGEGLAPWNQWVEERVAELCQGCA